MMEKGKVKKVDISEVKVTGKGVMFLSWLDNEAKDKHYDTVADCLKDFNEYYNSIFNPEI